MTLAKAPLPLGYFLYVRLSAGDSYFATSLVFDVLYLNIT